MTRQTPLAIIPVLLFIAGCATPPLRVVPVATIRNEAILEYSYGKSEPFRIESPPVEIIALVPRASGAEADAAAQQNATDAAAQIASVQTRSSAEGRYAAAAIAADTSKSTQNVRDAGSELRRTDAVATSQETDVASSGAHNTASERHRITDSRSWQEGRSDHATVQERTAASSVESLTQASSIGSTDHAGSAHAEVHSAHSMKRDASASIETAEASAISKWATKNPTIRKWATRTRVVVGESFDYVVEIENDSAIDLEFAEVLDALDDRLLVNASAVSATPYTKLDVDLSEQRLRVGLRGGIRRGQTVRIIIPAILKMTIAEQDK